MRRLVLLMLLLTGWLASAGCVAAIPLLFYAARNKQASIVEPPSAADFDAVRVVSHAEPAGRPARVGLGR